MKSSAWGIPYEIRPSKQVERRLVMETILLGREAGVDVRSMPFVGMGGVRYIDFLLAHKVLGISRYVSLEHDETLWERCKLNRPFESLEVFEGSSNEFLDQRGFAEPSVVWFDLEKMASKDAHDDIVTAATSVRNNSFLYVTAAAEMPGHLANIRRMSDRLVRMKDEFGALADDIPVEYMGKNDFFRASAALAMSFLKFGFKGRRDGFFVPLVYIAYRDSSWMVTVGGFFGEEGLAREIESRVMNVMPCVIGNGDISPFAIEQFNLTDRERSIFDRAVSETGRYRKSKNELKRLGFRKSIVDQYADLVRFIPRYVETAL